MENFESNVVVLDHSNAALAYTWKSWKTIWQIFRVSCSKEILQGWHIPCAGKGLNFVLLLSLLKSLRLCSKLTCRKNWHCNRKVRGTMRDISIGFCG